MRDARVWAKGNAGGIRPGVWATLGALGAQTAGFGDIGHEPGVCYVSYNYETPFLACLGEQNHG